MNSKFGFIILLVVIAVLTLCLAGLVGYVFLSGNHSGEPKVVYVDKKKPEKVDLVYKPLVEDKVFNLKKTDSDSVPPIARFSATIAYKNDKNAKTKEEVLTKEEYKIKEIFSIYFLDVTIEQVSDSKLRLETKNTLKTQINKYLESVGEEPIVYDVVLYDFIFQ